MSTWMRQGFVRSIQTSTIDLNNVTSNTATITVVNLTNTILIPKGQTHNLAGSNSDTSMAHLVLTNSTTVTASRFTGEATAYPVGFTAIEFFPGILRSVQAAVIELNGGTSQTATILSVNTTKAWVIHLGSKYNNAASSNAQNRDSLLTLTNATTVTASIAANPAASHLTSFMVAEFM